mmetsp:Transcript_49780/g.117282  ORF Transcript_49780/g.117282 Transcript_49780/m.117282 type:complete len:252 (+) Transcript_49780:79-834(+)
MVGKQVYLKIARALWCGHCPVRRPTSSSFPLPSVSRHANMSRNGRHRSNSTQLESTRYAPPTGPQSIRHRVRAHRHRQHLHAARVHAGCTIIEPTTDPSPCQCTLSPSAPLRSSSRRGLHSHRAQHEQIVRVEQTRRKQICSERPEPKCFAAVRTRLLVANAVTAKSEAEERLQRKTNRSRVCTEAVVPGVLLWHSEDHDSSPCRRLILKRSRTRTPICRPSHPCTKGRARWARLRALACSWATAFSLPRS